MFNKMNLPKPSKEFIDLVRKLAENRTLEPTTLAWHERQQPLGTNCAYGDFFTDESLNQYVESEYQSFFKVKMTPIIGIIKNTKDEPASYSPHSDRIRHISINFYIDTGGDNVETIYYDKTDPPDDLEGGHVLSYNDLPDVTDRLMFNSNEWYILPSRQYHSVENIETTRLILSLSCVGDVEDFVSLHKHLFVE